MYDEPFIRVGTTQHHPVVNEKHENDIHTDIICIMFDFLPKMITAMYSAYSILVFDSLTFQKGL